MGQNPISLNVKNLAKSSALGFTYTDAQTGQLLLTASGGISTSLNNTTTNTIKASPGRVGKVIVNAVGATSGVIAINDCASTGTVAAANLVWQIAYNETSNTEGAIWTLDFPCAVGITLTVDGGSPIVSVSFT